jgi:hypothetical protein
MQAGLHPAISLNQIKPASGKTFDSYKPHHALDGVDIQRVQMNALITDSMEMKALGVCS